MCVCVCRGENVRKVSESSARLFTPIHLGSGVVQ